MKNIYFEKIKNLAKSYTPEIDIEKDRRNPAYGISLALSNVLFENAKKLANIDEIYKRELVKMQDIKKLKGFQARGLVEIEINPEFEEELLIEKGEKFFAQNDELTVFFENSFSAMLSHNFIKKIISSQKEEDNISIVYEKLDSDDEYDFDEIKFFSSEGDFLYRKLSFSLDELFNLGGYREIELEIESENLVEIKEMLLDEKRTKFCLSLAGIEYALDIELADMKFKFKIDDNLYNEIDKYINSSDEIEISLDIKIFALQKLQSLDFENIYISTSGEEKPEKLIANDIEIIDENSHIFGKSFSEYDAFYIASDKCFSKKGAKITLDLAAGYDEVLDDTIINERKIDYKTLMRSEDFDNKELVDIKIEDLVFEYFNGTSWKRLIFDKSASSIFMDKKEKIRLEFIAPDDIERVYVSGDDLYFIRIRISKITNYLNISGVFICPYLKDISIKYSYDISKNNQAENNHYTNRKTLSSNYEIFKIKKHHPKIRVFDRFKTFEVSAKNSVINFEKIIDENSSVYLAFEKSIPLGQNVIYFEIENNNKSTEKIELSISMVKKNHSRSFEEIKIIDKTKAFSKSGYIVLDIEEEMIETEKFGVSGYFLKISADAKYNLEEIIIKKLKLNVIALEQKEKRNTIFFKNDSTSINKVIEIGEKNILDSKVYVNEKGYLSKDELTSLKAKNKVKKSFYLDDDEREIWIEYQRIDDIKKASKSDRVYEIDTVNGIIKFGDDISAKLIPAQEEDAIMLDYWVFEGERGNIKKETEFSSYKSFPSIEKISQISAISLGRDEESKKDLLERGLMKLYHRDRAVSKKDYEYILKLNSTQLKDVKLIQKNNYIDIIFLARAEQVDDFHYGLIEKEIRDILKKKSSAEKLNIRLKKAIKLFLSVRITLLGSKNKDFQVLAYDIQKLITKYINYNEYKKQERLLGDIPNSDEIKKFIENNSNLNCESIILEYIVDKDKKKLKQSEVYDEKKNNFFVVSGKHSVIIKEKEGE